MNISEVFIRRPVTTTLLMAGIVMVGAMAFKKLPISDLPNVDFPTVNVTASLPGANPETMASAVATPLERQFSAIDGLDSMTSLSTLGYTSITLQFNLSRKIADVPPDIEAAITRASALLPPGMPQPPTYQKVNPADSPIIFIALTSRQVPFYKLHEYADTLMAQRLSMINGVAQVGIFGPQKYAVHIQVNPDALASRGIGLNEVEEAVRGANVNMPVGTVNGDRLTYTIQSSGQLLSAKPFEDVIVSKRNGANVRIKDIGQAIDSVEDDKTAAFYNDKDGGQRSLILSVQRQPGANTVAVADEIKRMLPQLQSYLPPSVELHVLYDRSMIVRNSVHDVEMTLLLSFGLVVLVVFFFLRNLSATIIPTLALPLSVIGTFGVMHVLGYSLDNLSLMALTLCIGFIVDDAIVMLENIVRHVEHGEAPMEAALKGAREIGFTILSMTISLAAVLVPILFMGGVVGRLFEEFGVVIIVAIVLSGVVSLTLTPMLCSRFIRPAGAEKHGFVYRTIERFFAGLLAGYRISLDWVLRHRGFVMIVNILILVATVLIAKLVPGGFIPDDDKDQVFITTETAQGTSAQRRIELQGQVAEIFRNDPNVEAFFSGIGGQRSAEMGGQNMGRMFLHLKPRAERELDVYGVIQELKPKLRQFSDIAVYMQNPPNVRIGGKLTKSLYQFALQGPDLEEMYRVAPVLEAKMRALPELQDVTSDLQIKNPEVTVVIDRDKAATLGVSPQQVEAMLSNGYAQRWISTIYAPDNQYKVLIELDPKFQGDPALLSKLYIKSTSGQLIRLDTIARLAKGAGVQSIAHLGQMPAVTISFNLKPGTALGDAVAKVQTAARETLPASMTTSFQGSAQAFQAAFKGMGIILIVAVVFIYLVLGILYESFIHPLTILSGLPSAGLGALATLWLFKLDLNVYSCVGLVMLIGIVKKNAIMQIDFALAAQRDHAKSPLEAIREGCLIRFRPIMMTTMAALLGTLPIALGLGAGAESRRPLGLVVVGGLLTSQLITLYLTPVFYIYMDNLQTWLGNLRKAKPAAEAAAPLTET